MARTSGKHVTFERAGDYVVAHVPPVGTWSDYWEVTTVGGTHVGGTNSRGLVDLVIAVAGPAPVESRQRHLLAAA